MTYFNFFIDIDNIADNCNDFDAMGTTVQMIIEEVEQKIPEYQDEFIDATVCPFPALVSSSFSTRFLRAVTKGRYSYPGSGTCMKCTQNRRIQRGGRNLETLEWPESFELFDGDEQQGQVDKNKDHNGMERELQGDEAENICSMMEPAAVDVAVAKRAVVVSENTLKDIVDIAETTDDVEMEQAIKFVTKAEKDVEDCKHRMEAAKAKATFIRSACKEAASSGLEETADYNMAFKEVAEELKKDCGKDADTAQADFYKVKGEKIGLKTEIVRSQFNTRQAQMDAEEEVREAELEKKLEEIRNDMKRIEGSMKNAKKQKQIGVEEELMAEKEALTLEKQALDIEFEATKRENEEKLSRDYELAMGALSVEAANSVQDYLKEFADLIEPVLQDSLYQEYPDCFEKEPRVSTRVEVVEHKEEQFAKDDCPDDVE